MVCTLLSKHVGDRGQKCPAASKEREMTKHWLLAITLGFISYIPTAYPEAQATPEATVAPEAVPVQVPPYRTFITIGSAFSW